LSVNARRLIEDTKNDCFISIASLWEMAIKISLGKLSIDRPYEEILDEGLRKVVQGSAATPKVVDLERLMLVLYRHVLKKSDDIQTFLNDADVLNTFA
jgi:PIN domain nuclease of toxin-antitoxin system